MTAPGEAPVPAEDPPYNDSKNPKDSALSSSRATSVLTSAPQPASSGVGIALAVGALAPFDRECVRTMLRTLATHLSAYFRLVEDRESDLTLVEDAANANVIVLRTRSGVEVRLPRPLRLMPLADGLNSMIDIVRPQALPNSAELAPHDTLAGLLAGDSGGRRASGAWGTCWIRPQSEDVAFDRPLEYVARALAAGDEVEASEAVAAVAPAPANIRLLLRRDEVLWLSRPAAEVQRVVAAKLAQPTKQIKLRIWPNLARLPNQDRWITLFATLHEGVPSASALQLAMAEGIPEAEARRGFAVLLQQRYAVLQALPQRPAGHAPLVPVAVGKPASFLQRLKQRLLQMVDVD